MQEITVRGLQRDTGTFTRGLRRGERYLITDRGEPLAVCVPSREWDQMSEEREPYTTGETNGDDDDVQALVLNALALADGDAEAAEVKLLQAVLRMKARRAGK